MLAITEVILPDILVMYVAGDPAKPVPEQAKFTFTALEAKLTSLKGRKFYGVLVGNEYRWCTTLNETDNRSELPHPTWTIPGGKYARTKIPDWESNTHLISSASEELLSRPDVDWTRPGIEFYRSQRELFVMVPVQ